MSRTGRKRWTRSRPATVLAALILPADLVDQINSLSTLTPGTPKVEVLVNQEDPVKAQLVDERISTLLAQANLAIARRIAHEGGKYLDLLIDGGKFTVIGQTFNILGLRATASILTALEPALPPGPLRNSLHQVTSFASQARDNLDVAGPLIERLAQPIEVKKEVVNGSSPPLEIFAIAVAATLTLAFVTVLLVAGSLALEREENAFPRLTRGLISPAALLGEKVLLGMAVGLVVTLLMLGGMQFFVPLQWGRIGLWLLAILAGGGALAAAGRGAGRGGARGPRRLPARLHGHPAGRLPLADPLRRGRQRRLRPGPDRHRDLPLQAGAAGDDRRPRLGRTRHRRAAAPPGDPDRRLRPARPLGAAPLRGGLNQSRHT